MLSLKFVRMWSSFVPNPCRGEYPERVLYSFCPEPEPAELDALVAALQQLLGDEEGRQSLAYGSEWRRAALEEGVSAPEADEPDR
jgi:hypothetical protein